MMHVMTLINRPLHGIFVGRVVSPGCNQLHTYYSNGDTARAAKINWVMGGID